MSRICQFNCFGTVIDIYTTERFPVVQNRSSYYITPKRLVAIEAWMIRNNILRIDTEDSLKKLLELNLISSYGN